MDLSSKLASNDKLTSDEHKKCFENNLYLYCDVRDHKLDSYSKSHGTSVTADPLTAASEKLLEK